MISTRGVGAGAGETVIAFTDCSRVPDLDSDLDLEQLDLDLDMDLVMELVDEMSETRY